MAQFEQMQRYHVPRYAELPSIPLYKDQVVEELNRILQPLRVGEITATMVNNYVKVKAIPAPQKKRYDTRQLAGLYLLCLFKQVYSIGEITAMLEELYAEGDFVQTYDAFCAALEETFQAVFRGEQPTGALDGSRAVSCALAYKLYAIELLRARREAREAAEQETAVGVRARAKTDPKAKPTPKNGGAKE